MGERSRKSDLGGRIPTSARARTECQPAEPSLSPGSLLYVLYVLALYSTYSTDFARTEYIAHIAHIARTRGRVEGSWGLAAIGKKKRAPHGRTGIFFLGKIPTLARARQGFYAGQVARPGSDAGQVARNFVAILRRQESTMEQF